MSYVRIKKIKGKEYGYLVQSKWKKSKNGKKTSKQKVKEYLGRVYKLDKVKEVDFFDTVDCETEEYLKLATKDKIIHDLVRFELLRHGFTETEGKWNKDDILVDIKKKKIVNDSKAKCVLKINEGNLCNYRLKKLYSYEQKGDMEETGLELAKLFIDSGIDIPQEVFITYYEKL